jgi:ethanolamine utilization microcompartment shell protein EutS
MVNSTPQGPLNKNYWAISRSGVKQSTVYHVVAIKERDLAEDYGIDPATAANAIASMEPFSYSTIKQTSYTDLLAIAEELMDR